MTTNETTSTMDDTRSASLTPGPWKRSFFECANGELSEGVMSERTGSAVCWVHGRTREEEVENARAIAALHDLLAFVRAQAIAGNDDARKILNKATGATHG